MARSNVGFGKTNRHKSTLKAHTQSRVTSATPKLHGKAKVTPVRKRRAG